ncbi:MAG: deoxyribodipyrimidine photo-lyase [bacterium]|nr:DNA photolyase family protein [Acidimicrobiia bacterium]MCY4650199.1 deoxyribodipyrimidine photo-lyase [bacterium]
MSDAVVWFRRDLRLTANAAWDSACSRHRRVTALFVIDPGLWERVTPARRNLLVAHLLGLDDALGHLGGRLRIEWGDPVEVVPRVAERRPVYANADVTDYARRRDRAVGKRVRVHWYHESLVHPPGSVLTQAGTAYTVFTPFYRAWLGRPIDEQPTPGAAEVATDRGVGIPPSDPAPLPVGEQAALNRLEHFVSCLDRYPVGRHRPDRDTTSRLSVDLKWGAISPHTIVNRLGGLGNTDGPDSEDVEDGVSEGRRAFLRQLAWRDFHAHLMAAHPGLTHRPLKAVYDRIEWIDDPGGLRAWKAGRTGYPLVDAGMRQLRAEGWIHNRVRMVAASFLVKDLLIDWRQGERWFRRMLWDGDTSQNVGNWQWVAGCGADAAPYFRIFNPVTQSRKFDPHGAYIRRWVPPLRSMAAPGVHAPWKVDPATRDSAGVVLDETYPSPIVDHARARAKALAAYKKALST